jgi:DNA repair exonuclease SbcCD ATPase subunit
MKKPTDQTSDIEELFTSLKPSKQNNIMTYQEIKQDINRKKKYEQLKELLNNHKTRSAWSKDMKKPTDRTDIEELFTSLKPSKKEQAVIWLISPVIVLATWAVLIFICSL